MTMNFAPFTPFPASILSDDDTGWGRYCTDPVDLLPADPFGMELSSNLAFAIVGLFEDRGVSSSVWFDDGLFGFEAVGKEGDPHEALILSLGYLGVEDLLSVERVCRSLRSTVQTDPLLWRCTHIDSRLSDKITDDALLRLTLRGQGSLQCLSLAGCSKITDHGLRMVLESNPMLQKLSVAECVRLSIDGLINNLKLFKSSGLTGIKNLKLGGLFTVSAEHYEELMLLLGEEKKMKEHKSSKPRFYHCIVPGTACNYDRAIDIEMCQRCEKFKLVFDCSLEICRERRPENCRFCEDCIGRCVECGKCLNDCRFEETFCLRYLCSNCWEQAALPS